MIPGGSAARLGRGRQSAAAVKRSADALVHLWVRMLIVVALGEDQKTSGGSWVRFTTLGRLPASGVSDASGVAPASLASLLAEAGAAASGGDAGSADETLDTSGAA